MNRSTPGLPVHHQLLEFTQARVHQVSDAIQHLILCRPLLTSWQIDGATMETVTDFLSWAPKSPHMVIAAMKLKDAYSLEGKL